MLAARGVQPLRSDGVAACLPRHGRRNMKVSVVDSRRFPVACRRRTVATAPSGRLLLGVAVIINALLWCGIFYLICNVLEIPFGKLWGAVAFVLIAAAGFFAVSLASDAR